MKNYTFHWELKNLIIQFIQAMDDCVVKRYNEDKDIEKEFKLSVKYMPKSRTLHYLVNKQQHISLPVMSVWIGGISRDQTRVFNKIDGPMYMDSEISTPLQPIPIDITMNVSLLAKYQNDMDQMVSNFVPYFDPYVILSWNHPNVDREIRSEVIWNGNLTFNYPTDVQATDAYRVGVDTSFNIKGWMFKKAEGSTAQIHTITSDFIGVSALDIDFSNYEEFKEGLEYDRFVVSGIPTITRTDPIWVSEDGGIVNAYGNLLFPEHVYISGDMVDGMELIDAFSDITNLSADNPPFYGVEITSFTAIRDSILEITIPKLTTTGFLDIIILNDAGYGSIVKNALDNSSQKEGLFVI